MSKKVENRIFDVRLRKDLSLSDLGQLFNEEFSVIKTPHTGNFYPNNLAVAKLGIPMLVYDRNLGLKDRNFHPDRIIKNGCQNPLTQPEKLMTHACCLNNGKLARDIHMKQLKKVFPTGRFHLYSDYYHERKELVLHLLSELSECEFIPKKFNWQKYVDETGNIFRVESVSWREVVKRGVYGIDNFKKGYLIPNFFSVFFYGFIEALETNREEVYHLSGPDMYQYIGEMQKALNDCLKQLRKNDSSYPSKITFNLIPVANARFAIHQERKEVLDELVNTFEELCHFEMDRKSTMKSLSQQARKKMIPVFDKKAQTLKLKFYEALLELNNREIFYDIYKGDFLSQHDLESAEDLYVHPWCYKKTTGELDQLFLSLNRVRNRKKQKKICF